MNSVPRVLKLPGDATRHARNLNVLAEWLAQRDVPLLTAEALRTAWGMPQADALIFFGNSLLCTLDVAVRAWNDGLAKRFLISGGIGHSTSLLVENIRRDPKLARLATEGRSEADLFSDVLAARWGIERDALILETISTNCGENVRESRAMLERLGLRPHRVLVLQDPTMQRRMGACFDLLWDDCQRIHFAPFVPVVEAHSDGIRFSNTCVADRWPIDRFVALVLGEIPRLRDDANGYGPRGSGYIAHVEIPDEIEKAFKELSEVAGPFLEKRRI